MRKPAVLIGVGGALAAFFLFLRKLRREDLGAADPKLAERLCRENCRQAENLEKMGHPGLGRLVKERQQ